MTIEELMDLQEAGSRARILGLKAYENPYLKQERLPKDDPTELGNWVARHDAWNFGWEAEDACREGTISMFFRDLLRPRASSLRPGSSFSG